MSRHNLTRLLVGASIFLTAGAGVAHAADAPAADSGAAPAGAKTETADFGAKVAEVTVTAAAPALAIAPQKSNLQTTQPQTIITRDVIEHFVPQTADYTQIANLSPSITGGVGQNGPGLSESKSTLRGFGDGNYNVTYDGIPWGDANGPTHHSTSFFPASTIGGVIVDRGPGKANDIGAATFGGSINLFSPEVSHTMGGSQTFTGGSWNTWQSVTKLNTGDIKQLNDLHVLANFQELWTDGYLTYNKAQESNQMVRGILPINDKWTLTVFGSWNFIKIHTNDNAGATLAQAALYGKNFALNNDPKSPNYYSYNVVTKNTYFHYAKLEGELQDNVHFETQPYYYYYENDTHSTVDATMTAADIAAGKNANTTLGAFPTPGLKNPVKNVPGSQGYALNAYDIPGYIKFNQYWIYGDVSRADWNFGWGDLRPGFWIEHAHTHRYRYDYDASRGWMYADYRQAAPGSKGVVVPQNEEYDQASGWSQYQPFVDLELRPTDRLTITPGFKWVNWRISVSTLANQKTRTPLNADKTFTKDLEYLTANYRLMNNWSVYFQYATGILAPDISAFQVSGPTANPAAGPDLSSLVPQTSTNYQLGTVYHSSNWTADFDLYKIDFKNKIATNTGPGPQTPNCAVGETCYYNQGGVTYQGVEGQVAYAFTSWLSAFANGSINEAKDNVTHLQVKGAPKNTFGLGLLYKRGGWTASIIDKYVGEQWASDGQPSAYHINGYHQADVSVEYAFDRFKISAQVQNITNSQAVTSISPGKQVAYDQYYWQAPANFQISLKASF